MSSDIHKPDGITLIPPENALAFLEKLPIKKFHGIGAKTAEKMKKLGIHDGADLKARTELELVRSFGKAGRHYYRIVRAEDHRPVKPDRIRKSVGAENTFGEDLETEAVMLEKLRPILVKVCSRMVSIQVLRLSADDAQSYARTVCIYLSGNLSRDSGFALPARVSPQTCPPLGDFTFELKYRD